MTTAKKGEKISGSTVSMENIIIDSAAKGVFERICERGSN